MEAPYHVPLSMHVVDGEFGAVSDIHVNEVDCTAMARAGDATVGLQIGRVTASRESLLSGTSVCVVRSIERRPWRRRGFSLAP